jgi:transposase-like protein
MARRRTFTPVFKFETVLDMVRGEKTVAQICRERDITESLLYKWRDAFFERAPGIFTDQRSSTNGSDPQAERIAELERLVGRQTLEIEVLKKARSLLGAAPRKNGRSSAS